MSKAVICDECGIVTSAAVHCADMKNTKGKMVYGADVCMNCKSKFGFSLDEYGWHAKPRCKMPAKKKGAAK